MLTMSSVVTKELYVLYEIPGDRGSHLTSVIQHGYVCEKRSNTICHYPKSCSPLFNQMLHISITDTMAAFPEAIAHCGDTWMEPGGLKCLSISVFFLLTFHPLSFLPCSKCCFGVFSFLFLVVGFCLATSDLPPNAVQ